MTPREEYEIGEQYIRRHSSKVYNIPNGIAYHCLYHDDANKSASHIFKNEKVLDYCSICGNIYIRLKKDSGAWEERKPKEKYSKFETFLYYNMAVEYKYYDLKTGNYLYSVFRLKDKRKGFPVGVRDGTHITSGLNGVDTSLAIFTNDVRNLLQAISNGEIIFYTEGEEDSRTVHKYGRVSFTCGGVHKFKESLLPYLKGGNFIVCADNDKPGIEDAERITALLNTVGTARMLIPPGVPEKGDITDYMATHTQEDLQELIDSAFQENPLQKSVENLTETDNISDVLPLLLYKVDYDRDGNEKSRKVQQVVRNFEIVLENDNRFSGKIRFDEFSRQTFLIGQVPWETKDNCGAWSSYDDSALFSLLQSDYGLTNRNDYFDALKNISLQNRFHPVRDILDSLKWDETEHIRGLLPNYLGAEDTDYTYQVMRLWMLGAVARIYCPGCKFDYTMILQGAQGIGKSTFLQLMALNDDWFNDSLDSLDSDKAAQSLMGSWIIELAELKSLARTAGGVDSVKRFLTATQDKYRVPYERRADIFLRQCIFAGTTNKSDFLQDETGNRRFLIILTGVNKPQKNLFTAEAIEDIKAAWAQAVYILKTENPQLILPDSCRNEARRLQEDSMADDGKIGIITQFLEGKNRTCALEIWQEALKENGRPQKWQASEINNIVLSMPGWIKMKSPAKFGNYGSQRGLQRQGLQTEETAPMASECSNEFIPITKEKQMEIPFD